VLRTKARLKPVLRTPPEGGTPNAQPGAAVPHKR
jgi:hypothetical protein